MADADEPFGSSSIRLVGAFNPVIVTHDWLLAKGLIDEADREYVVADDESRSIVTPVFSGGRYPWVTVEVTREQLSVSSTDETETPERLREFVVELLTALPETPVSGLAISHVWFVATGEERWKRIADIVAPKAPWVSSAPASQVDSLQRRTYTEGGHRDITLQPSERKGFDLFLEVERHWELDEAVAINPAGAIELLDTHWEKVSQEAQGILEGTLGLA